MRKFKLKQDHQRWGYSTVIHLEQTVYLAIWKYLKKEKRQESKHLKGHSAPRVSNVTFLLKGHSGQPVSNVTFLLKGNSGQPVSNVTFLLKSQSGQPASNVTFLLKGHLSATGQDRTGH